MQNKYTEKELIEEYNRLIDSIPSVQPPLDNDDYKGWSEYYSYMWNETSKKCILQGWEIKELKARIKELENNR